MYTCLNVCVQDYLNLISTIGQILDGIVNDDPLLLAYEIADFERNLSFVSMIEQVDRRADYLCGYLSQRVS